MQVVSLKDLTYVELTNYLLIKKVVTRKVDRNLSLRPPKILSGANPVSTVPTKKIVAASDGVKVKNNTSKVCGKRC